MSFFIYTSRVVWAGATVQITPQASTVVRHRLAAPSLLLMGAGANVNAFFAGRYRPPSRSPMIIDIAILDLAGVKARISIPNCCVQCHQNSRIVSSHLATPNVDPSSTLIVTGGGG